MVFEVYRERIALVSGFKFSRASYVLSLLRPQIVTDLELKVWIVCCLCMCVCRWRFARGGRCVYVVLFSCLFWCCDWNCWYSMVQVTCECVRMDATVFIRLLVVVTSLTCVCKFSVLCGSFGNGGQLGTGTSHYICSRDLLLLLQSDCSAAPRLINFPDEMRKRDKRWQMW